MKQERRKQKEKGGMKEKKQKGKDGRNEAKEKGGKEGKK